MAREEELKRIDLKVNVSCCEGCRRKVMKAMSLKGVLRTEIQPSHDRVTVVGDVDAKVLVKKLAKIGKIAEVLPPAPPASEEGKKRDDGSNRKDGDRPAALAEERSGGKDDGKSTGDKAKAAGKQECKKCAHEAARADGGNGDHANGKAPPKGAAAKTNEEGGDGDGLGAKSLASDRHAAPQPQLQMQQHYLRAEPPMVVPGFYAPAPAPYYGYYGMPPPPPPMSMSMPMPPMGLPPQLRPQPSRFDEDFFNDDNTIGCRVM